MLKKSLLLMCFFLFFSCGLEDKENSRNEWIGKETEFKQKFIPIKEGSETLILNKSDSKPLSVFVYSYSLTKRSVMLNIQCKNLFIF